MTSSTNYPSRCLMACLLQGMPGASCMVMFSTGGNGSALWPCVRILSYKTEEAPYNISPVVHRVWSLVRILISVANFLKLHGGVLVMVLVAVLR